MSARQRQFDFASQYPAKRRALPFFAHKFIRYLYRRGVASVLHRDAIILLTLIVLTEDQVRYSRPVGFWASELTAMTGMTSARISDMTKLCVERGWLAYCPGAKGVQGTYFVCVPGGDDAAMSDAPLGQDHDVALTMGMERGLEARGEGLEPDQEAETDTSEIPPASNLSPLTSNLSPLTSNLSPPASDLSPLTSHPSPSDIATDPRYATAIAQLKRCGVKGAASCLARSLKLIDLDHVSAVLGYHISRAITPAATVHNPQPAELLPYEGGLLVERLTNIDYAALPPAEGWSEKLLSPAWSKAHELATELERRRKAADQATAEQRKKADAVTAQRVRAQQLELQFGKMLDELALRDPSYLWGLVAGFNESLARWGRSPKNPHGLASPLIRNRLLDLAEQGRLVRAGS